MDIYKSVKISIGTVMKNPDLFLNTLKLKKCLSVQLKNCLIYLLRYVPDQYRTQQMCNAAILENYGTLKSVPDCYKNREFESMD